MRSPLIHRIGWGLACFPALFVAAYATFTGVQVAGALGERGPGSFHVHPWLGMAHIVGGTLALAVGVFQFLQTVQRKARLHRALGWAYVAGVVASGLASLILSFDSDGGLATTLGFGLASVVWLVTLALAIGAIRRRQVQRHREWMIRCFAVTFAAVMLRLILPLLIFGCGIDDGTSYRIVSFACWVPNLAVAEWWIRRTR